MSAAAKGKPIDRQQLIDSARFSARLHGCVCDPEIRLLELRPQIFSAEVRHDDFCPLGVERGRDA
jgi:hypothetical protein